jgi:hypothetical protein
MTKPALATLEAERYKLYVTDAELIRLLGVPERLARATIHELERKAGFPRKQSLWGNRRYWPAVRDYLDRTNGLSIQPSTHRGSHG